MKQLTQTFTTSKGSKVEITESQITGKGKQDVNHFIKVNGKHQSKPYNTKQLLEMKAL